MKRPAQLDKLRQLFERRANAALLEVRQGQMRVSQLEIKRNEIRECVNAHQQKLTHLDNSRPSALQLSVEHLRAEAGARDIVERDLRKEVFYLQAAEDDIVSANRDLLSTRTQW